MLRACSSVRISRNFLILLLLTSAGQQGHADLWSDKKPETVTLTRRLAPVAARSGTTVHLVVQTSGSSIPSEAATILQQRVQTLLLDSRAGEIRLIEQGVADTMLKCTITGYEPKSVQDAQRQVGLQHETIKTWIGNIEASVQVTDAHDRPITASNLKFHLENDFVTGQKEEQPAQVTDKKRSLRDRLASSIEAVRGGNKSDMAALVGQGAAMKALTRSQERGARAPSDAEWRDALLEGMAAKVASQIAPVNQEFVAALPAGKEFEQIRLLARDKRWGDVQESAEKMTQSQGATEADRLYLLGLSYEALACSNPEHPPQATEELNKASMYYGQALKAHDERELHLADMRVKDSLDHYLEIQHLASNLTPPKPAAPEAARTEKTEDIADNSALIAMANSNLPESILLNYVQTVENPKFDASSKGLVALGNAKVPANVIVAVQKRMSASSPAAAHPRPTNTAAHRTQAPQAH